MGGAGRGNQAWWLLPARLLLLSSCRALGVEGTQPLRHSYSYSRQQVRWHQLLGGESTNWRTALLASTCLNDRTPLLWLLMLLDFACMVHSSLCPVVSCTSAHLVYHSYVSMPTASRGVAGGVVPVKGAQQAAHP
jgi:hypothetical protein